MVFKKTFPKSPGCSTCRYVEPLERPLAGSRAEVQRVDWKFVRNKTRLLDAPGGG